MAENREESNTWQVGQVRVKRGPNSELWGGSLPPTAVPVLKPGWARQGLKAPGPDGLAVCSASGIHMVS